MAEKRKRMGEVELKALVAREISLAQDDRAIASKKQTKALEYYQGEMKDVPAEVGRSSAVSRDLADVMGWVLPGIMRVYTASEHMAVAEPVGADDDEKAKEATNGINYVFWKQNDGYRIVYSATWDSLLAGNGVVKVWHDETPKVEVSFHSGLSDEELAYLLGDETQDIEVLEYSGPYGDKPTEDGMHEVKIKRTTKYSCTKVEAIPPEDYGKDGESKTCEEARFQFHRSQKTRSDLVKMGFSKSKVDTLGRAADDETSEEIARDRQSQTDDGDPSMELVDLYECYVRVDINDDGIAELCRVYYAGNKDGGEVLDWEEWEDETPFVDIPCSPMPHRWEAASLADETMDVQRIKTVLIRQALDNTYATNNPQRFVTGKITNPDELFSPSFGGVVFGDANSTVVPLTVPFVANHAYDAINYQDQVIERRTGVSRTTMALDPDALQNQTATANQNAKDAAYSQIELIARNQGEFGWKFVFRKILRMEIKHQDKARIIRMAGKPVQIDPRHWNVDMDISINVGLGTGSRDRDMAMLQSILNDQIMLASQMAQNGFPDKALDMLGYILTTLYKKAEAAGIRSPELFYPEFGQEEIAAAKQRIEEMQNQPNPEIELEKAKMQLTAETEGKKAEANMVKEAAQLDADLQTKEADRQNTLIIAAQQQDFEREKLAEDARQKDLDRQQQWNLEVLKINTQSQQADKASSQSREIELAKMGMKDSENGPVGKEDRMADVMERFIAAASAPKRVVRGPDGKAMGMETVVS